MGFQGFAAPPALVPYLNLQHGIRMDYPNSWMFREEAGPYNYNAWFVSPPESPNAPFQENLGVQVQPLFAGATLDSVVSTWQAMMQNMPVHLRDLQQTTLAGNPACRITVDGPLPVPVPLTGRSLMHIVVLGTKAYTFNYLGQDSRFDAVLPTVNQMLATLQLR